MDSRTPVEIELLLKNGEFVTRRNQEDSRQISYKVRVNAVEPLWMSRKRLLSYMNDPNYSIRNAKLKGNQLVPVLSEEKSFKVVKITKEHTPKLRGMFMKYLEKSSIKYISSTDLFCENQLKTNFKSLIDKGYVGVNNGRIECLFTFDKSAILGVTFVYTVFGEHKDNLQYYLSMLSKRIKNSVFYFEYLPTSLRGSKVFKFCDFKSTYDNEKEYLFHSGCYLTEYNPLLLAIAVEKKYFPDLYKEDIDNIEIECVKEKELEKYFSVFRSTDYSGVWINTYNQVSYAGFTYLKPNELSHYNNPNKDIKFLIAKYKGIIIGVIKFGVWNGQNHQAVSYIDVSIKYRNKGIATKLINSLEKYLYDNMTLVLTDESEMGKKCHMNVKFKEGIKKVKVKTYEECLRDRSYD